MLRVSLNEHLDGLRAAENQKPLNQRRDVPTLADIVRTTGITRATLYNMAANKYESVRLDIVAAVINTLRAQGFPTTITDLLTEHPVSTTLSSNNE